MNHGEARVKNANRKYRIIDGDKYRVKRRFGPFYFFIRTNYFKRIEFDHFGDVVRYVIERKKQDRGHQSCGETS